MAGSPYSVGDGIRWGAAASPAFGRRAGVHQLGGALSRSDAAAGGVVRAEPRGRRGSRPGHVAGAPARPRRVRGRSSLKTWLFSILVNQARKTGTREHRSVPVADPEPAVDPSRFDASGGWADPPEHWIQAAEARVQAGKLACRVRARIEELPGRQREVVLLRDVEGMSSQQVCAV